MFEAYEVAVKLKLIDQFSGAMGIVTRHLMNANTHASELERRLSSIGKMFTAGAAITGWGVGMVFAFKAASGAAAEYEQQLNRLRALNLDASQGAGSQASLVALAQRISQTTKGTSQTDALRLVTETQAITGSVQHTQELVPMLSKIRFGLEAYMAGSGHGSGHGAMAERQFADIVKVMELRGLMRNFSPERAQQLGDLFVRNYIASGGQVNPSSFLAMFKTGGVSAKLVSDDFMYALGHVMQEKGGSRVGTALMSTYQNLIAGRTTQQVAEQLAHWGLINPADIKYGRTGHITKLMPGALKQAELMQSNPLAYMNQVILPALAAKGVNGNDMGKVLPILNQLASNRTASDFLASLYMERGQIANYMHQARSAMGVNGLYDQGANSYMGKLRDLEAKKVNLEKELGEHALPIIVSLLARLIPLVDRVGKFIANNPAAFDTIAKALAGLTAFALVSGPLMMAASAMKAIGLAFSVIGGSSSALLSVLGPLAALAASFSAGYAGGSWLYNKLGTGAQDAIGRGVAYVAAFFGIKDAQDALDAEHHSMAATSVRPGTSGGSKITGHVILKNRVVGALITGDMAEIGGRPMTSAGVFDPNLGLAPYSFPH